MAMDDQPQRRLWQDDSQSTPYTTTASDMPARSTGRGWVYRMGWIRRVLIMVLLVAGVALYPRLRDTWTWYGFKIQAVPEFAAGSFAASLERIPVDEHQFYTGAGPRDHFNISAALMEPEIPQPFVFKAQTIAQNNPLRQAHLAMWVPQKLITMFGPYLLPRVHFSWTTRRFRDYSAEYPMTKYLVDKSLWTPTYNNTALSGKQFLAYTQNTTEKYFMQVQQPVGELFKLLPNMTDFVHRSSPQIYGHLMLWMSSAGVVNPLHFEVQDSIHMQLYGRKRYLLLDVSHLDHAYVYPMSHPQARTSKMNLEDPREEVLKHFPKANHITKIREVVLVPGDVLVIPAMTLYWEETLPGYPAYSVHWWTASRDYLIFSKLMTDPYPWHREQVEENWEWTVERQQSSVATYIEMILDNLLKQRSPTECSHGSSCRDEYIQTILDQEYRHVMDVSETKRPKYNEKRTCPMPTDPAVVKIMEPYVKNKLEILENLKDQDTRFALLRIALDSWAGFAIMERGEIASFLHHCICTKCSRSSSPFAIEQQHRLT